MKKFCFISGGFVKSLGPLFAKGLHVLLFLSITSVWFANKLFLNFARDYSNSFYVMFMVLGYWGYFYVLLELKNTAKNNIYLLSFLLISIALTKILSISTDLGAM